VSLALASVCRITGLAAALAAFGVGCASPVSVEQDPLNDFARYRTWAWFPSATERVRRSAVTPQLDAVLRVAIARELAARGFVRAPAGEAPDFLVGYELGLRTQVQLENEVSATQTLQTFHGGRGDVGAYEIVTTRQRAVTYEIGVLGLDVIDTQERALVWRGIVRRRARDHFSELAGATVAEILAHFPAQR
jgi:Domain of unknown function (DUF4136)